MHIGVIAYEMEGARSGVGRYLEGLLSGLDSARTDWRWTLFFKGKPFEHDLFASPAITPLFDHRPDSRPILWEQTRLPWLLRRARLDLLFSPGYSLPTLPGVPKVVTLHDLSFEHLPAEFRPRERLRRRFLARSAARQAKRVLVDTQAMAADLTATYGTESQKIGVVPLAIDGRFFNPEAYDLAELGLTNPYVLCLGSILPRRRLEVVLDAFSKVAPEGLDLVIAGRDRLPDSNQLESWVAASPVASRIRRLPYVPEPALPAIYANAAASIYISTYEGYGLPPLESIAAGTPAIVSPGMALDDLAPAYPFRSTIDVDALATALTRLLRSPRSESGQQIEPTRQALGQLTWTACSERWLCELERAVR